MAFPRRLLLAVVCLARSVPVEIRLARLATRKFGGRVLGLMILERT